MRISGWSSDVCSSDLLLHVTAQLAQQAAQLAGLRGLGHGNRTGLRGRRNLARWLYGAAAPGRGHVGRHRRLDNLTAAADRTQHLAGGGLLGKAGAVGKPRLEGVLLAALEIEDNHRSLMDSTLPADADRKS